jgi:hypothetical protein
MCVCIYMYNIYIYIYIYILAVPVAHYYCDCLAYFVPEKLFYICGFRSDQFLCLSWEEHENTSWYEMNQTLFDTLWLFSIANYRPGR